MPIDTQAFFLIIMSGFITVWSYRKRARSNFSDFEYLGFSAFWGFLNMSLWSYVQPQQFEKIVVNPLTGGLFLALGGYIIGAIVGKMVFWKRKLF
jgi:hypothetical protein